MEQTAPANPMTPAQKSVTCKSLGCAISLNQIQSLICRRDASFGCGDFAIVSISGTLHGTRPHAMRQARYDSHEECASYRRNTTAPLLAGYNAAAIRTGNSSSLRPRAREWLVFRRVPGPAVGPAIDENLCGAFLILDEEIEIVLVEFAFAYEDADVLQACVHFAERMLRNRLWHRRANSAAPVSRLRPSCRLFRSARNRAVTIFSFPAFWTCSRAYSVFFAMALL